MIGRPKISEADPYFFRYIDKVDGDDPVVILKQQLEATMPMFLGISESQSVQRYARDKWSIRELLNHVNDAERTFAFRGLWFGRGLRDELPSFEQEEISRAAEAHGTPWNALCHEFQCVRESTIALFGSMPPAAWDRGGVASGKHVSVRALAYIISGHLAHHVRVLQTNYGLHQ